MNVPDRKTRSAMQALRAGLRQGGDAWSGLAYVAEYDADGLEGSSNTDARFRALRSLQVNSPGTG